jgi:hypothetical protein
MASSFEVELRSNFEVYDDMPVSMDDEEDHDKADGTYNGQVIVRSRFQTVRNPLSSARPQPRPGDDSPEHRSTPGSLTEPLVLATVGTPAPQQASALQDPARMPLRNTACTVIQRAVRRFQTVKRGFFVPIDDVTVGDADWCIVFERGREQDRNRRALAKCLLARYGLDVIQSVARGDDSRNSEKRKVFMRVRARREALREEAERIGLMCELDPGGLVLRGREKSVLELAETGKPRLYGRADAALGSRARTSVESYGLHPVSIIEDTRQASYGYHRYSRKRDHFFAKPVQKHNIARFNTGDRQVLVKSLVERALSDYYYARSAQLGHSINDLEPFHQLLCNAHLKGRGVALEDLCAGGTNFCMDVFPERSPHELESLRCWGSWKQLEFWKPKNSIGDLVYVPLDAIVSYASSHHQAAARQA